VEAVWRIIAVDGLERASLREVADEAGLAVGSVRHYFAGSDELLAFSFATVIDSIVARLESALPAVQGHPAASPEGRNAVLTLLGELLPLDEQRAVEACVWMAFRNAARIRPFLGAEADRSHREVAAVVGRVITALLPGRRIRGGVGGGGGEAARHPGRPVHACPASARLDDGPDVHGCPGAAPRRVGAVKFVNVGNAGE
jgi:AcrR family transcriptional regulator